MAPPITTTTNPTAPTTIKTKPRTYLRKTKNNTPGTAPPIMTPRGQIHPTQRKYRRLNPNIVEPVILATPPNSNKTPRANSHSIEETNNPARL